MKNNLISQYLPGVEGITAISCFAKDYPECLIDHLDGDHPPLIYLRGNKELLYQKTKWQLSETAEPTKKDSMQPIS